MDSLLIKNFRGFRHLTVERLGRVNLIVGKNNVGKSSLLEALRLYFGNGALTVIANLLQSRDELPEVRRRLLYRNAPVPELSAEQLRRMLHLHHSPTDEPSPISIGPMRDSHGPTLTIRLERLTNKNEQQILPGLEPNYGRPAWVVESEAVSRAIFLDDLVFVGSRFFLDRQVEQRSVEYLPVAGLTSAQLGRLYDQVAVAGRVEDALVGLRLMSRDVEQLLLVGEGTSRQVLVKVQGASEHVPLRSVGDGMNRILGIILALVNAKGGVLLADEIENGIHYSVMPDVWKLIFRLAAELDVQVFATTHSWDCIEGFQHAAVADQQNLGMLIRLERRNSEIQSTLFDEEELTIATRAHIEVR